MRQPCLRFGFLALCLAALPAASAGGPQVAARTQLSATPSALSVGPAGPFNRVAFDVVRFGPPDASSAVTCVYASGFRYRCDASFEPEAQGTKRRVTVTIPDLGRGKQVVVRFSTSSGHQDVPVELANGPQVVHEIEALPIAGGGQFTTGSNGQPMPLLNIASTRATTMPAMAATQLAMDSCDQVRAEWVTATATDPVFQSQFGALNGSVVASRPVVVGSRVHPTNLPEWLITYPLSAIRLQFIAHYEVMYRVGSCPHRIIADRAG